MTRRFDANRLLRDADAFVAKAEAKPAPKSADDEMLGVRMPAALKETLKIAAIKQRTTVTALVLKALEAAGYKE